MSYSHLSIIERSKLEILHQQGWSARAIARKIGRHHATVSREIHRHSEDGVYRANTSEQAYQQRRKAVAPVGKWTEELAKEVEEKLQQTWSPEQISERFQTDGQPWFRLKPSTAGSMQAVWNGLHCASFATKANAVSL
jgi:IS30 family transposase